MTWCIIILFHCFSWRIQRNMVCQNLSPVMNMIQGIWSSIQENWMYCVVVSIVSPFLCLLKNIIILFATLRKHYIWVHNKEENQYRGNLSGGIKSHAAKWAILVNSTNSNSNRQFQCTKSNDPNLKFGVVRCIERNQR